MTIITATATATATATRTFVRVRLVLLALCVVAIWWYASARKWFTGPRRTIDEVDGVDVEKTTT